MTSPGIGTGTPAAFTSMIAHAAATPYASRNASRPSIRFRPPDGTSGQVPADHSTARITPMSGNGRARSVPPRREERDSMGALEVPEGAYYGASTQRAVENFPISGERFDRRFIWALGTIKYAAAIANRDLGLIEPKKAEAIAQAAAEVAGPDRKSVV